jgi:hypothetical protein
MKKLLVLPIALLTAVTVSACEVCKRNQPKVLQEFTHGAGPGGATDYIIMGTAIVIVAVALVLAIKHLARPNEDDPDHIKNIIANEAF